MTSHYRSDADIARIYAGRTRLGGLLLAALVAALTLVSVRFAMPFSGFAALVVTFGGVIWLTIRDLRRRFAGLRDVPIGDPHRFW